MAPVPSPLEVQGGTWKQPSGGFRWLSSFQGNLRVPNPPIATPSRPTSFQGNLRVPNPPIATPSRPIRPGLKGLLKKIASKMGSKISVSLPPSCRTVGHPGVLLIFCRTPFQDSVGSSHLLEIYLDYTRGVNHPPLHR